MSKVIEFLSSDTDQHEPLAFKSMKKFLPTKHNLISLKHGTGHPDQIDYDMPNIVIFYYCLVFH